MGREYLDINETTKLSTLDYDVSFVLKFNDYYYIKLENEQSFVTNGEKLYDTSFYGTVTNVFFMGERLCVACNSFLNTQLIDLDTKEVLFNDNNVNDVAGKDQVLWVSRSNKPNTLFDINSKKYLYDGSDYKYDYSLENGYYIYQEVNPHKNYKDLKRRVINSNGDIIIDDIIGIVYIKDNHLIITKDGVMDVITFHDRNTFSSRKYAKGENTLAKPIYINGEIILVEKGYVRFYSLENELLREVKINGLEQVVDSEYVSNILKLCIASSDKEDSPTGHVFLNIKTLKTISHYRISEYPYWTPKCFVGFDAYNDEYKHYETNVLYEPSNYYFYDLDLNEIACIKGNKMKEINLEDLFQIQTWNGQNYNNVFVNASTQVVKPCIYDTIVFKGEAACGYAISDEEDRMDIVDLNLNVLVDHVDEKIEFGAYNFWDAYLVNDYVALILCYHDMRNLYRSVLFNPDGEVIMDSNYKVFPIDNTMQLMGSTREKTLFLNTKTGEIKPLTISAKADKHGLIDFDTITNPRALLPNKELIDIDKKKSPKIRIKTNKQ